MSCGRSEAGYFYPVGSTHKPAGCIHDPRRVSCERARDGSELETKDLGDVLKRHCRTRCTVYNAAEEKGREVNSGIYRRMGHININIINMYNINMIFMVYGSVRVQEKEREIKYILAL